VAKHNAAWAAVTPGAAPSNLVAHIKAVPLHLLFLPIAPITKERAQSCKLKAALDPS
jgi:hypothetical protein